jgi:hypothetical protein
MHITEKTYQAIRYPIRLLVRKEHPNLLSSPVEDSTPIILVNDSPHYISVKLLIRTAQRNSLSVLRYIHCE